MGWFGRNRTAVAETAVWVPMGGVAELEGDAADMDDQGQVNETGRFAYRVQFTAPGVPQAWISLWTYAAYGPGAAYSIGLRYEYTNETDPGWSYVGYAQDPESEEFGTADDADGTAAEWASSIAQPGSRWHGILTDVFDWNGEPFPVDAG